jgi:hypothetical protein
LGNLRSDLAALLRADFSDEAENGFPRLIRVPQTQVVQFLDYYASLPLGEQSELLDALGSRASVMISPQIGAGASFPSAPAFDIYWNAINSQGPFTGGFRYCDVKFLGSIPKIREFGSYENWIEQYQKPWVSDLALTPRKDLLPEMSCLKTAKGRLLKKQVRAELEARGFVAEVKRGAEHTYVGSKGDKVRVDFGSYMGQICYGVSAVRGSTRIVRMSFESLWSIAGGWNYLTEENATRSIAILPELVEYLIELTGRLNRLR